VGVAASAVIVAYTDTEVARVSGVGEGPGVGVCVMVGINVGVEVSVGTGLGVAVGTMTRVTGEGRGDCRGETHCPHPVISNAVISALNNVAAFRG
jgi:hypothetical protein